MNNVNVNVTAIIKAAGLAPWLSYGGFDAAVRLADAVCETVLGPIERLQFAAAAAAALKEIGPDPLEGLVFEALCLADQASAERPTPLGSVELWGSLMQRVDLPAE